MSKKKDLKRANEEIYTTKGLFAKYIKRYGIILLISAPIIFIFSYVMSTQFSWYNGAISFLFSLALLLLACLIGLVVFTKKDDKAAQNTTKEKERDPFAD